MSEFLMPSLGADMEKGTVVEWLKKPGDRVERGDVVAVVETQKGAFEVEVFEQGVLSEILVPVGIEVPVGAVLARIDGTATPRSSARPPAVEPPVAQPVMPRRETPASTDRPRISPAAARRAAELGIDVRGLSGSGPYGAIAIADVEAAAARAPSPAPRRGFDPTAMRQAIAAAMARSKREIPHYYLSLPIDLGRAMEWLAKENDRRDIERRLLAAALLLKAVALALRAVPQLNGFWIDGVPKLSSAIHVGWAISLRGGGLMAPAIHDADRLTLDEAMTALRDLVTRARTTRIRGSEMMDPTITVTSLGERGAASVLGVVYPPQLAIVGFGAPRMTPSIVDGEIKQRPMVQATLSADHRASDGAVGSRLLAAIDHHLQKPEDL